jgi:mitogen-activated protein kinase 1/3
MLVFDPAKRISVDDALQHSYMASLANAEDEPKCDEKFTFEFENADLSKTHLQELIWQELAAFHPEAKNIFDKRKKDGELKIDNIVMPKKA